jgi:hypothetical protein
MKAALDTLVSYYMSSYLRFLSPVAFESQSNLSLLSGFLVLCHSLHRHFLRFSITTKPGRSLFVSESITLQVDSLHAAALETVHSRAVPELIRFNRDNEIIC